MKPTTKPQGEVRPIISQAENRSEAEIDCLKGSPKGERSESKRVHVKTYWKRFWSVKT